MSDHDVDDDEPEDDAEDSDCLEDRLDAAYARADAEPAKPKCPALLDYDADLCRRLNAIEQASEAYDTLLELKEFAEWALLCGAHKKGCGCDPFV